MKKESFLIYKSFYAPIEQLTDEDLGKLFRALFEYQINGEEIESKSSIFMAFQFFKNQFLLDEKKYIQRCEKNRENVKKRWENNTTVNNRKQTNTKRTDKDNDKDKDKVKDKVNDKEKELINPFPPEFLEIWEGWKDYKKTEHRFSYKSIKTEQMALTELYNISDGNANEAKEIIKLAIVNGWKGLFKRKKSDKLNSKNSETQNHLEDIKSRLL